MTRYNVYIAHRDGVTRTKGSTTDPLLALVLLENLQRRWPGDATGIWDDDDEERGDVQAECEEAVACYGDEPAQYEPDPDVRDPEDDRLSPEDRDSNFTEDEV